MSAAGSFYQIRPKGAPREILEGAPDIVWLPDPPERRLEPGSRSILEAAPLDDRNGQPLPLVSTLAGGGIHLHFSAADAVEGILLERYHDGLQRLIETRMPFNYSRLPNWVKGAARAVISRKPATGAAVPFPPDPPVYAVEWLRGLARLAGGQADRIGFSGKWPGGNRAALTITHDVDTGWLFHNRGWLERICDIEESSGLFGAWYCVPMYSRSKIAKAGIERLAGRKCEIGVHGYNHDAKFPFLTGAAYDQRLGAVKEFAGTWGARGFRSEWLYRTPRFLETLAGVFFYDSSVPASAPLMTTSSANGCSSCLPYRTTGGLLELPLSLPMDEFRHWGGFSPGEFWDRQVERAARVVELGGLVVLSLHPQSHQAANEETLGAVDRALRTMAKWPNIWRARPDEIAGWVAQSLPKGAAICG